MITNSASKSCVSRVDAKPITAAPTASQIASTIVVVTSRPFGTSPFLRASSSRFCVGFSVLSPPSFLLDMSASQEGPEVADHEAAAAEQVVLQQHDQVADLHPDDP